MANGQILFGGVLPLCRTATGIFSIPPTRLGGNYTQMIKCISLVKPCDKTSTTSMKLKKVLKPLQENQISALSKLITYADNNFPQNINFDYQWVKNTLLKKEKMLVLFSLQAISSFPTMFSKAVCFCCIKMNICGGKGWVANTEEFWKHFRRTKCLVPCNVTCVFYFTHQISYLSKTIPIIKIAIKLLVAHPLYNLKYKLSLSSVKGNKCKSYLYSTLFSICEKLMFFTLHQATTL